jgi:hypothetical protein
MRNTILFSIFLFAILSGCSKKKYGSTPTLKFKSVNTKNLATGQLLQFTLSFTDAEGDLTDSIYVQEIAPACANSSFATQYSLPSFPASKNQAGDILVTFGYNAGSGYTNIAPQCQKMIRRYSGSRLRTRPNRLVTRYLPQKLFFIIKLCGSKSFLTLFYSVAFSLLPAPWLFVSKPIFY